MLCQYWWRFHVLGTSLIPKSTPKSRRLIRDGWLSQGISTCRSPKECKALTEDLHPIPRQVSSGFLALASLNLNSFCKPCPGHSRWEVLTIATDQLYWGNPSQRCPAWMSVSTEVTLIGLLAWRKHIGVSVQNLLKAIRCYPRNLATPCLCLPRRAVP